MTPRTRARLRLLCLLLLVSGVGVNLTVRDSLPILCLVDYLTPWPVIALLMLATGALSPANRSRRLLVACTVGAALLVGLWLLSNHRSPAHPASTNPPVNLLFWNAGRGLFGWKAVLTQIADTDADVVGLVEAGGATTDDLMLWQTEFPDYACTNTQGGIVLLTKGTIHTAEFHDLSGRDRLAVFSIELQGQPMTVCVTDIDSNPVRSKRKVYHNLWQHLPASGESTIVMGDFNTPLDSVWLQPFHQRFVHAFAEAGQGFLPTWPVPLPFYTLDHIWLSPNLQPVGASHTWTKLSDHAMVQTGLQWRP